MMNQRLRRAIPASPIVGSIVALTALACGPRMDDRAVPDGGDSRSPARAVAVLHPTEDQAASGRVTFTPVDGGIRVEADLEGLSPGPHGIHVHEYGDCSAPDGAAAGGHFNPEGVPHAGPDSPVRHVGDLGNLAADSAGAAHFERVDSEIALAGPHSIVGRAVIIHAGADDLTSQPSGAAGPRVACGVIGVAGP